MCHVLCNSYYYCIFKQFLTSHYYKHPCSNELLLYQFLLFSFSFVIISQEFILKVKIWRLGGICFKNCCLLAECTSGWVVVSACTQAQYRLSTGWHRGTHSTSECSFPCVCSKPFVIHLLIPEYQLMSSCIFKKLMLPIYFLFKAKQFSHLLRAKDGGNEDKGYY